MRNKIISPYPPADTHAFPSLAASVFRFVASIAGLTLVMLFVGNLS